MATTRKYRSQIRKEQADLTRQRIVEATFERLRTTRPVDLSFADVAEDAGVSVRTVYRHFPTAEDLFSAVSDHVFGNTFPGGKQEPNDLADLVEGMKHQFALLEQDPAIFRLMFAVPSRSRIDLAGVMKRVFAPALQQLSAADRRVVYAIMELLGSPYSWDVLHNHWGITGDRGPRAVLVAGRALLEYLERNPKALSLREAEPSLDLTQQPPKSRSRRSSS
jgi:AcrR family transcriptional regulator